MLTPAECEALKERQMFDRGLAEVLIPVGHPRRFTIDNAILRDQFVLTLRRMVDPAIQQCVSENFWAPKQDGQPPIRRRLVLRQEVINFLTTFVEAVHEEAKVPLDPKRRRKTQKQLVVTVREALWRCDIAKILQY